MRIAVDPGRMIRAPFALSRIVFSDFRAFPTRRRLISPSPCERVGKPGRANAAREFSGRPEDPRRLTVDPGRRVLVEFAPTAPRFRRLSYISEAPPADRARAPIMRPEAISSASRGFSGFHEDPKGLAVYPGRQILGAIS